MSAATEILKIVSNKIHYKRNDNLLNHLKTYFHLDVINYTGCCDATSFKIWRYSQWGGLFYVVIQGQILLHDGKEKVMLSAKMNSAGQLLSAIIFLGFFFSLGGFRIETISNVLGRLLFAVLPIIVITLSYFHQRKVSMSEIEDIIK